MVLKSQWEQVLASTVRENGTEVSEISLSISESRSFMSEVNEWLAGAHFLIRWPLLLLLLFAVLIFGMYGHGYDGAAFLYAQF